MLKCMLKEMRRNPSFSIFSICLTMTYVDCECAFWSCDFAHLSSSKKNKKCDVELTVWGYGGRLGEQNCEYDKKSL